MLDLVLQLVPPGGLAILLFLACWEYRKAKKEVNALKQDNEMLVRASEHLIGVKKALTHSQDCLRAAEERAEKLDKHVMEVIEDAPFAYADTMIFALVPKHWFEEREALRKKD